MYNYLFTYVLATTRPKHENRYHGNPGNAATVLELLVTLLTVMTYVVT